MCNDKKPGDHTTKTRRKKVQATGANLQHQTVQLAATHHRPDTESCKVTHPVLGTCSEANFPTRVFATLFLNKNPRWVKIIMLSLHLESMTFVRLLFFMKPGDDVLTIETMIWSASFPWKESTLKTVFSQGRPAFLSAFSIAFRCASYGVMILKFFLSEI